MYHINDDNEVKKCHAVKRPCKFIKSGRKHYLTAEEAEKSINDALSDEFDLFANLMNKNEKFVKMQQRIDERKAFIQEQTKIIDSLNITESFEAINHDSSIIHDYNEDYLAFEKLLTDEEKDSIKDYTALSYMVVNQKLREKDSFVPKHDSTIPRINRIIENIDSALMKAPKRDRVLYRAIGQDFANYDENIMSGEDYVKKLGFIEGNEIQFSEFLSTTVDPGHIVHRIGEDESTYLTLIIKAKSGAPVDFIREEKVHVQDSESEILVPRNAKYKIEKIERVNFVSDDNTKVRPMTVFLEEI